MLPGYDAAVASVVGLDVAVAANQSRHRFQEALHAHPVVATTNPAWMYGVRSQTLGAVCELFAFTASAPTVARLALAELAAHGGGSGPHADGWGVAFHQGRDALIVREPQAAHDSACLHFLLDHAIESRSSMAHVRKARRGAKVLANTQPFARELGGRVHTFAHNGMLSDIDRLPRSARFAPIGETDSELAFLVLLDRLSALWDGATEVPPLEARRALVTEFAADMRQLGPANFIYSDTDVMFVHADRRTHADGTVRPPGLHWLCSGCEAGDELQFVGVRMSPRTAASRIVAVASVPLSAENWQPLALGELVVLKDGQRVD